MKREGTPDNGTLSKKFTPERNHPGPSRTIELWNHLKSGLSYMCCRLKQRNKSRTFVIGWRLWRASGSSSTTTYDMACDELIVKTVIIIITATNIM